MNRHVSIGGPIALIVLGAILYYALTAAISGVNLGMVGIILMVAGVAWLLIGLLAGLSKRKATVTERTVGTNGGTVEREVHSEDR